MDDPEAKPEDEEGYGSACGKQMRHLSFSKRNCHPSKLFQNILRRIFAACPPVTYLFPTLAEGSCENHFHFLSLCFMCRLADRCHFTFTFLRIFFLACHKCQPVASAGKLLAAEEEPPLQLLHVLRRTPRTLLCIGDSTFPQRLRYYLYLYL